MRFFVILHQKRKKHFHKAINVQPDSITTTSLDEELIKKTLLLIEQTSATPIIQTTTCAAIQA
jgi:hypothetical protein